MARLRAIAVLLAASLSLGGCDLWDRYFGPDKVPLPGERIPVLKLDRQLSVDPALADTKVLLPKPYENRDWPQAGGNSSHVMHHLALAEAPKLAWQADIGSSAGGFEQLLADPVIADGKVFVMDRSETVSAYDVATGKRIWAIDLTPGDEDDGLFGGGLAVMGGRVFVTTPFAYIYALDAADGKKIW